MTTAGTADVEALLRELVAGQREIIRLLERQHRPAATPMIDLPFHTLLVAAVADRAFSTRELIQHAAAVDGPLRAALAAAGLLNARKLGKWLRTIEGRAIAGVRLDCIGADNQGLIWRVSGVSDSQTHAADCGAAG